jgi:DNA uptake protein ComE-like DNA-binding protein
MWERICDYLTFTRKERLGILVLLAVIVLLFIVPYFIRPEAGSPDVQAYQRYKEGIRKFRSADQEEATGKNDLAEAYPDHRGQSGNELNFSGDQVRYAEGRNAESGKMHFPPAPFYFDPNRISAEDWRRLGLPDKLIHTLLHYLQKGGRFRTATDLKKLYGLKRADYERLLPYVRIQQAPAGDFSAQHEPAQKGIKNEYSPVYPDSSENDFKISGNQKKDPKNKKDFIDRSSVNYSSYSYTRKIPENLDINRADSSVWVRLPGIGIKLAARIIHFRDKLGGFYSVEQLRETFGLADSTFLKIRPYLHMDPIALRRIDLNGADLETLQAHPYIRRDLAEAIIRYREQHGGFDSVAELRQLARMDQEKFLELRPYLEVK